MNMTEAANMIEFLQAIGWTDSQITNYQLCVEGRRSISEAAQKHEELGRAEQAE